MDSCYRPRLAIAPRPYPDETLISWFERLALANYLTVSGMRRALCKWRPGFSSGRLRFKWTDDCLDFLEQICWMKTGQLRSLAYPRTGEVVSPDKCCIYCPDCHEDDLKCGRLPYDRRLWHSPFAFICEQHQGPLIPFGDSAAKQIYTSYRDTWDSRPERLILARLQSHLLAGGQFTLPAFWVAVVEHMRRLHVWRKLKNPHPNPWSQEMFSEFIEVAPKLFELVFGWAAEFPHGATLFLGLTKTKTVAYRRLMTVGVLWRLYQLLTMEYGWIDWGACIVSSIGRRSLLLHVEDDLKDILRSTFDGTNCLKKADFWNSGMCHSRFPYCRGGLRPKTHLKTSAVSRAGSGRL